VLALPASAQAVWHVDASAATGGSGASWASAFTTLGAALAVAQCGDEIWVADGTYFPPPSASADPRATAFYVPRDLKLYGGFAGGETSVAARVGLFATTVLSGDLGALGATADNAHHVVRTWGTVTIDGFRIERGNAVGAPVPNGGAILCETGQILSAPALFEGSTLELRNCTFALNTGSTGGGGLFANTSAAVPARAWLRNSIVSFNRGAVAQDISGAIQAWDSIAPGVSGPGVLNVNPRFENVRPKDLCLRADSPAVDVGNLAWLPQDALDVDGDGILAELLPVDLAGATRVLGLGIDLGSFERP